MTFLIAPDGTIAKVYEVTDVATHPDDVLADIRALAG
jgi:peroxiredoxin